MSNVVGNSGGNHSEGTSTTPIYEEILPSHGQAPNENKYNQEDLELQENAAYEVTSTIIKLQENTAYQTTMDSKLNFTRMLFTYVPYNI